MRQISLSDNSIFQSKIEISHGVGSQVLTIRKVDGVLRSNSRTEGRLSACGFHVQKLEIAKLG